MLSNVGAMVAVSLSSAVLFVTASRSFTFLILKLLLGPPQPYILDFVACREKKRKREDIRKNVRDAILVSCMS